MFNSLENLQNAVGPLAAFLIPLTIGFVGGAFVPRLLNRRSMTSSAAAIPENPDAAAHTSADPEDRPNTEMSLNWEVHDHRRTPRRAGKIVEVLVAPQGGCDTPRRGLILNRSNGGLGVLLREEFAIGSMMGVMPAEASKLTPWVEVEVKSCRKNPDGYELGLQFLSVPPYATLVMFG